MLIRSQDKKELHNLDGIKMIKVVSISNGHLVEVNSQHTIGTYSTKEKAIKVLDMICEYQLKKIDSTMVFSYNLECNVKETRNVVFQMPQDSEV